MLKISFYLIAFLVILGLLGYPALTYMGSLSFLILIGGGFLIMLGFKTEKILQNLFFIVILLIILTPLLLSMSNNAINNLHSSVNHASLGNISMLLNGTKIGQYFLYTLLIVATISILVLFIRWRLQIIFWKQREIWKASLRQPSHYSSRERIIPEVEHHENHPVTSDKFSFSKRRSLDLFGD